MEAAEAAEDPVVAVVLEEVAMTGVMIERHILPVVVDTVVATEVGRGATRRIEKMYIKNFQVSES